MIKFVSTIILAIMISTTGLCQSDTITVIGVGDIMMGTNYPNDSYLPKENGRFLLQNVLDTLRNADITFGNLEGVLLDRGGEVKKCKDPKICYAFRTPTNYVEHLTHAGFDVVSLANNHSGDFGNTGRTSTAKTLEQAGIYFAGQTSQPYVIFNKNNITYAFAAFAPNKNCLSIHQVQSAQKLIQKLDSLSDIVIVSFHGGAEGPQHTHVTRATETYYGENRGNVYNFAHKMVEAGADIVFGHGPHVVRAVEVFNNRFIAYSLGNFCTYGRFNLRGLRSLAPIVKVFVAKNGEFYKAKIISAKQTYQGGVTLDSNHGAAKEINTLTALDFPESPIIIDSLGHVILSTE